MLTPTSPLSVVIGAGGTGGHIYPGLALADALRRAVPDALISFVGTTRGLETRLIPGAGYRLHTVDMIPFDPSLGARRFLLPAALLKSGAQVRSILRAQGAQGAHVAVGMGGYPSAPVILGAKLAGLPSVIHESNAVPGRANQFAARLTPHLTVAFDRSRAHLSGGERARVVGMPIAASLAGLDRAGLRDEARRAMGARDGARLIVFNGGSLGAARLTEAALGLAELWRSRTDVQLLIKTGPAALEETRRRLGASPVARAVPYLDRMDHAYAAADLVVCRAGSATVAELAATGVPAVLVPYPHAPGDHQTHNARVLTDAGAGLLLPDPETTAEHLADLIGPLLDRPERLAAMARAADPGPHARAADLLAAEVLRLAGRPVPYPHLETVR
ncbi:UDP-N-acetylglucosamine--N-acetylmuramyl-(pentapeptide) pyrophosphoryl-undecaprenol N-acetylglucosamine transferase [Streptomyces sp. YC504]|uniref:UDP-N-acetylglucosamine--N-acetylmuramyl-(pentapeptide) pyrophosphoryl-undecaprenol N-acetylglucosamine transferase n=1 Tax=Streptomyces mesophilus TaxID=1775132 RepID=A0A6G4XHG4_9ACTN|nr:UDP-N-acetylglucosamine--N-acetylmuramyl-(pentapeptide) pyrophosphoryl-undecaprenol N-acetylglucosamine transferase [Streptomyces mesophilus]NGO76154.1 UDP-N-acetylglucosamine--N-acetylmuramyl-(pentapeptide) pyrophosphoryl-undecaprenol N-acetylglucosamine transferase [Streptomyces mesophilus]